MSDTRQILMGFFMALLFMVIVLGSMSLSLMESGHVLAQAPVSSPTFIAFTGEPILTLVNLLPGTPAFTFTPTPLYSPTPTATFTPPAICPPPPGWVAIVVQPDDTLNSLANAYNVDLSVLALGNCYRTDSRLIPGTVFYVPIQPTPTQACHPPVHWVPYTVRYGDTLYSLAYRVGMPAWQLQSANCLTSPQINQGQLLFLPYYPPVYYTPYPSPTRWSTSTPHPPTSTPMIIFTMTPTLWPSPTFTWRPTSTFVPPTVETQTPQSTTALPPSETPLTPPSNTPLPPPSNTPIPPPTDTPVPPPTDTPPPTSTPPPPPPTDTPHPPPTVTPHPPPTATNYLYPYP